MALSHCSPAVATSFIQSPYAVSSGASVPPVQIVTFGLPLHEVAGLRARLRSLDRGVDQHVVGKIHLEVLVILRKAVSLDSGRRPAHSARAPPAPR